MKIPPIYDQDEQELEQLVIAADCEEFAAACHLLFITANDLRWGGTCALIDLQIHPEAGEHFQEARQLIKTRFENGIMRLVRACLPLLDKTQEVIADETAAREARELELIRRISLYLNAQQTHDHLGDLVSSWQQSTDRRFPCRNPPDLRVHGTGPGRARQRPHGRRLRRHARQPGAPGTGAGAAVANRAPP